MGDHENQYQLGTGSNRQPTGPSEYLHFSLYGSQRPSKACTRQQACFSTNPERKRVESRPVDMDMDLGEEHAVDKEDIPGVGSGHGV